ncbi:hypothetical protein [Lutibacter sp.]
MKKRFVLFSILFISFIGLSTAQSGFGFKFGLSYNSNGELSEFINNTKTVIDNKGKGKSGFNVGFYGKIDLGPIYVRPELVYTKTTSEYELNSTLEDYKISKLDMPVLVGIRVIGPLHIFAGPAFQYVLDNELNGLSFNNIENDFTVGMNIGASVEIGRLGLDVRYERGLSTNEAEFVNDIVTTPAYRIDSRPEQIIFSLSYRLSNKKS